MLKLATVNSLAACAGIGCVVIPPDTVGLIALSKIISGAPNEKSITPTTPVKVVLLVRSIAGAPNARLSISSSSGLESHMGTPGGIGPKVVSVTDTPGSTNGRGTPVSTPKNRPVDA